MEDRWAIARFAAFAELGGGDVSNLEAMAGARQKLKQGEVLRHEGDDCSRIYFLHSGWTASSVAVANGARLIIKVHMPGDLLGLPGLALAKACDTIHALSPALVSIVEPKAIGEIFVKAPRLAALLFLISQEERVRLMDRLVSVGRTDAVSRVAELILQLHARVRCTTPDCGASFYAPLTQTDIADLTGLSKVHVNRTLQQLRGGNIVKWTSRTITILDEARLRQLAQLMPRQLARDLSWIPADQTVGQSDAQ
jgi:CRP/FNR family transcriptional regulator